MNIGALTLFTTNPWIIVAASFLVVTITHGTGFSFGVFVNPFRESFEATSAAVSGIYSVMLWVFAFCGIAAGWAVDRYGPRITIRAGALILGSGLLLTSFTNTLWQLYITCGLIGVGLSSSYVPTMTTISRSFTERRGLALGINSAGVGFGPLIMAPPGNPLHPRGWLAFCFPCHCMHYRIDHSCCPGS